jgi:hypothetical protein
LKDPVAEFGKQGRYVRSSSLQSMNGGNDSDDSRFGDATTSSPGSSYADSPRKPLSSSTSVRSFTNPITTTLPLFAGSSRQISTSTSPTFAPSASLYSLSHYMIESPPKAIIALPGIEERELEMEDGSLVMKQGMSTSESCDTISSYADSDYEGGGYESLDNAVIGKGERISFAVGMAL